MTPIFSTMPIALSGVTTLASVLTLVLSVVLWVGLSIFIGWTLSKVMHNQGMKTKPVFIMAISAVFSILLIARYGLSFTAVQGLFLLYVLVYASCSDLTTHTVDDWLWLNVLYLLDKKYDILEEAVDSLTNPNELCFTSFFGEIFGDG